MHRVNFITTDSGDDLLVSFAIASQSPGQILSLTLLRSPKYESALIPNMRGVSVSWEDEDKSELLLGIERSKHTVKLDTTKRQYVLDVSGVDARQMRRMSEVFQKMNFDNRFRTTGIK